MGLGFNSVGLRRGLSMTLHGMVLAMVGLSVLPAEEAEPNQAPPATITEVRDEAPKATSPSAETLPLPPPAPLPILPKAEPEPVSPPLNLDPDPTDILGEVRLLAGAKRHAEALELLRTYRLRHPYDDEARRLELAIEVDHNEHRMRSLIDDQRRQRLVVLADPTYLTAKAAASRPVVKRLEVAEFLLQQQRLPEALSTANAILSDHPYDEAVMTLKKSILETMVEIERRKALSNRDLRHSEVMKEVIEEGTMPSKKDKVARKIFVFDEDLAEIQRQKIQDRLDITLDNISYENAPVGDVLKLLFATVGMNYIILDEAISSQTVTMFLVDSSVGEVLGAIQNMIDIHFNYRGGTVYITNSENSILVPEIIRLKAGLTNVNMDPMLEGLGGIEGDDEDGDNQQDLFPQGEDDEPQSDIERFMAEIETLVPWPEGSVWYLDRKSNTLFVRSTPSTVSEVKRLIRAIDYNNVQVLIEAKFVEVSEDAFKELGVDWKLGGSEDAGSDGVVAAGAQSGGSQTSLTDLSAVGVNPALSAAANAAIEQAVGLGNVVTQNGVTANSGLAVGVIGAGSGLTPNFEVNLRALESKGKANTLSEPKILTISNSTGLIEISRERAYVGSVRNVATSTQQVTDETTDETTLETSSVLAPEYETEREGIRLRVMPSVARNSDTVTLAIFPTVKQYIGDAETSELQTTTNQGTGQIILRRPQYSYRQLATALHVKNGETVALGGLITEINSEGRRGIPFLSSIPWAGRLFRTDTKSQERRKLMIFVTARIIDPSGAELGEEERWLRDTARVILPAEVQEQLRQQDEKRQLEAEEGLRKWQEENQPKERESIRAGSRPNRDRD